MPKADDIKAKLGLAGPPLCRIPGPPPTVPDHAMVRCIGQGSYGEVWLARNAVGTWRAVKVVHRARFKDDHPYEREFIGIQKYEPVSRANEGLVDVLQIGRNDAEGYFYYVMELADDAEPLAGEDGRWKIEDGQSPTLHLLSSILDPRRYTPKTLAREIRARGRLPVEECITLGMTLNLALGHLHRNGLIHRDVKPSNIIFVNGVPKLADIGLVTELAEAQSFVGTEGFIPPEGPNSRQADLYALGKVLYEASMAKDRQEFPEPYTGLGVDADSKALMEFNAVVLRACAVLPKDRYRSAEEMTADLALLHSGQSVRDKHALQRRLKITTRVAAAIVGVMVLGVVPYYWAIREARLARDAAASEAGQRKRADGVAQEAQANLYVSDMQLACQAWEAGNLNRARRLLDAHFPAPGKADPRGFEWRYIWQLCQGDAIANLLGHKTYVQCIAITPDGRLIASGDGVGVLKLWDLATGKEIAELPLAGSPIRSIVFSPDARVLAVSDFSKTLTLWDIALRRKVGALHETTYLDKMLLFLQGGRMLASAATNGLVSLWDVAEQRQVGTLAGSATHRPAIAVAPDGTTLAAASGQRDILLWDTASRRLLARLAGHTANVVCLAFSPDGATLASGSADSTIRLWDVGSRREIARLFGHRVRVSSVAYSPDGSKLASASVDGLIKLWDVASRAELGTLRGHSAWVNAIAFFPDGRHLASASDDWTVKLWDISSLAEGALLKAQDGTALDFRFSPDGKSVAVIGSDGSLAFWDVGSREQTSRLTGLFQSLSESGQIAVGQTSNGMVELWDTVLRRPVARLEGERFPWAQEAFSPDDRFFACADADGGVRMWEVSTGRLGGQLPPLTESVAQLWFVGGAQNLTLGIRRASEPLDFWEIQSGREGQTLPINLHRYQRSFQNGLFVSLLCDGSGRVFFEAGGLTGEDFDSQTPLTNSRGGSGFEQQTKAEVIRRIHSRLATPDGQTLIVGGETDITVWDMRTGRQTATLHGHGGWVTGLALSADGRTLASTSNDGTLKLWNLALQRELLTFPVPISPYSVHLAFAPDGNSVAALSSQEDRLVRLFHAPSMQEIQVAEKKPAQ